MTLPAPVAVPPMVLFDCGGYLHSALAVAQRGRTAHVRADVVALEDVADRIEVQGDAGLFIGGDDIPPRPATCPQFGFASRR